MMYLSILLIATAFGMYIQSKLKEKLGFYARFPNAFGLSGKEVAERMLAEHGLTDIRVMSLPDRLRDHYTPQAKTLNLSPEVYGGRSISAAAVAAHECGHVLQDVNDYPWLPIRSALAPIVSSVSRVLSLVLIILVVIAIFSAHFTVGMAALIVGMAQCVLFLFTLITLPMEYDASRRALDWMKGTELNRSEQLHMTEEAMRWASRTYIMLSLTAVIHFVYYLNIFQTSTSSR